MQLFKFLKSNLKNRIIESTKTLADVDARKSHYKQKTAIYLCL